MLPGVELARRRRVHHHHYELPRRAPADPKPARYAAAAAAPDRTDMDEPALLARARLEEKLRRFSGPPRWKNNNKAVVVRNERVERKAERNNSEDQKGGRTSLVMLKRRDSRVDVCAVCLDEVEMRSSAQRIYKKKEIMKLPCSHIYHSDCLLPWLANNSHCPCCRTIVPSSFIL
ncbi:putative transcription factor C2H2 family [Dioscorea sansibarensis]